MREAELHDFADLGKAIPYGVHDLSAIDGWVSVGVDHDTAEVVGSVVRDQPGGRACHDPAAGSTQRRRPSGPRVATFRLRAQPDLGGP